MPRPLPAILLAAWLLAAAPGCGDREPPPPPTLAGPPTWRASRDEGADEGVMIDVRAQEACRVTLRLLGAPDGPIALPPRDLAAGETARLSIAARMSKQANAGTPVATSDQAAGRSEAWTATFSLGWEDGAAYKRPLVLGARPGRGRALGAWTVEPSPRPTPLPYEKDLELAAAALADGGEGLTLEGQEHGSRVRGPLDAMAGDRSALVRVVLRVERMAR